MVVEERDILEKLIDFKNKKVVVSLYNFYSEMKNINKDMVKVLNLLDEISKNSNNIENKKLMRTKILDSYNELPRKTLNLINEIITNFKE
jgi:Fe2+ transport system protein B